MPSKNMKRRMLMVVASAMMVVVLAAGTAHAGTRALTTLTNTASQTSVPVGGTIHFYVTETNNESFAISPQVRDSLPANVKFVSATASQGQCSFESGGANGSGSVDCDLGTLPPNDVAVIDIAVVPTQPGIITNVAYDLINQASASAMVNPA